MSETLAVVTVTYSPGEHLDRFLSTITDATRRQVAVIMVDNGSTDGAPESAEQRYPFARLLRSGGNIGYGAAANRAVTEVDPDAEYVVVVNPDIEWSPGALDALLDAAERWPRAGSLGPSILEPDGTRYPSARRVPGLADGLGHAVLGSIWPGNPWTTAYRQLDEAVTERPVGWLSGSCLLLRRRAFDSIGGFDSRYFMYMEDVDLGDRLARAGWQNVYVPNASVTHDKGHAAGRHPELMLPAHHDSAYRFQSDRHDRWWQAPLRLALRVGLSVRSKLVVHAAVQERDGSAESETPQQGPDKQGERT